MMHNVLDLSKARLEMQMIGWLARLFGNPTGTTARSESRPQPEERPAKKAPLGYRIEVETAGYVNGRRAAGRVNVFCGPILAYSERGGTPNDAHVSQTGVSIICYQPNSSSLATIVRFLDKAGKRKGQLRFGAISYSCGISDDGKVAVVQFANSDCNDGGALALIDVDQLKTFKRIQLEGGWAESYKIYPEKQTIEARYSSGRAYQYKFDGSFVDRDKFRKDQIEFGDPTVLVRIVREDLEHMTAPTQVQQMELLSILDQADKRGYPGTKTGTRSLCVLGERFSRPTEIPLGLNQRTS
jgi:hypothetical protein